MAVSTCGGVPKDGELPPPEVTWTDLALYTIRVAEFPWSANVPKLDRIVKRIKNDNRPWLADRKQPRQRTNILRWCGIPPTGLATMTSNLINKTKRVHRLGLSERMVTQRTRRDARRISHPADEGRPTQGGISFSLL